MTEAVAAEWAKDGVQVNMIAPGAFATQAQRAVLDDPAILAAPPAEDPRRSDRAAGRDRRPGLLPVVTTVGVRHRQLLHDRRWGAVQAVSPSERSHL